jgi:hypothetical protein
MRFVVLVKASEASEAGVLPSQALLAAMGAFNEEMVRAGVLVAGEGLQPSSSGSRLRWAHGKPEVTDGPFAPTGELVSGYWLMQVASKAEAVALSSRAPFEDGMNVEIRQVFEAEDFGAAFTPELQEQEERQRARIAAKER